MKGREEKNERKREKERLSKEGERLLIGRPA